MRKRYKCKNCKFYEYPREKNRLHIVYVEYCGFHDKEYRLFDLANHCCVNYCPKGPQLTFNF